MKTIEKNELLIDSTILKKWSTNVDNVYIYDTQSGWG